LKKWSFDADYLQARNCDYGCPCEFSAPPSQGCCEGLGAWRIKKGEYDGLALDASAHAGEVRVKDLEFSYPDKAGFIAGTHYHN